MIEGLGSGDSAGAGEGDEVGAVTDGCGGDGVGTGLTVGIDGSGVGAGAAQAATTSERSRAARQRIAHRTHRGDWMFHQTGSGQVVRPEVERLPVEPLPELTDSPASCWANLTGVTELKAVTVPVRCPSPGHRWRRGDPGPCGLKLGELRPDTGGSIRLYSLSILLDRGDGHYEVLGKPTKGRGADLRSGSGADSIAVPPGGDLWLRCPQCGVETHLSKLTTSIRSI